jgi:hypothetical protein
MERTRGERRLAVHGEQIDVDGPWWRGFYQGWCDGDDGRPAAGALAGPPACCAGYHAGWSAATSRCLRSRASTFWRLS